MPITSKTTLTIMFRLNNLTPFLVFFFITDIALLAEDHVIGYAPSEPLFVNQDYPTGLKEEDLRDLPLSDPKLRIAYAFLVRAARSGLKIVDESTPEMVVALSDLKRRGDSATPLLLDIMAKNHNTRYEDLIPLLVSRIGTIKMEPYLEYFRQMVKTRSEEMSASANEAAATVFLEHGTAGDAKMLEELATKRPFLAPSLERAFEFQRWKRPDARKSADATVRPVALPIVNQQSPKKAPEFKPAPTTPDEKPTSSIPWSIIIVFVVAASGLVSLLLKNKRKMPLRQDKPR